MAATARSGLLRGLFLALLWCQIEAFYIPGGLSLSRLECSAWLAVVSLC